MYSALAVFVSRDSLAQPLKFSGHLFFIVSSLELVFWVFLSRRKQGFAIDGTSVRQRVLMAFRINGFFGLRSRHGFVGLRCCHDFCSWGGGGGDCTYRALGVS